MSGPRRSAAQLAADLLQMAEELDETIDGGEEAQGRDGHISENIRTLRDAAARLMLEAAK